MKQDLFIQRLEELAEIKRIKPVRHPGIREADSAQDIWRNGQVKIIDKNNNETWSYEVKRLKTQIKPCEDCGKQVKDRVVSGSLYQYPKPHWRKHCSGCNRVWNPETQQYDIMPTQAQYFFIKRLKQG